MNAFLPEVDTAYEIGFTACASPIWEIIENGKDADRQIKDIRKWIDRFYNHSIGTQVLTPDKRPIRNLKDAIEERYKK